MAWDERIRRARQAARLGGATLGVAATLVALGLLWRALHAEEGKALLAALGDGDAE